MGHTGRCACGQISLRIEGDAIGARQCWCRQCQQIAAGGPTNNAFFRSEDVRIDGTLGSHAYIASSGNTLTQYFCPSCGSHIYAQSSARLHLKTVRLGAIDEPHGMRPQAVIWISEAPEWAIIDPALERFEGQPPPPPQS